MRKIFFFLLPLIFSLQSPPKVFAVVQKWPVKLHSNSSVSLEGGENNNILFDSDVTTIYNKLTVYADADFDFSTEFELAAKSLEELEVDVFDAETSQPSPPPPSPPPLPPPSPLPPPPPPSPSPPPPPPPRDDALIKIDDIWYRSPNLSGGSTQQGTSSILSQLMSTTTCSKETWVNNYQDCDSAAWREVRAVHGFSMDGGSTSYDMYFDTNGANKGYNNYWKCYGWCGNGDPFYTQYNNYIVVSSKYYQFLAGTTYAIQYFVDDSATIYLQSEGSSTLDITLSNAVNGSPYGKVVSFSATETKAYRIIATIGNGVYDTYFHISAVTNALEMKCDGQTWSTCYAVEI